MLTDKTVLVLGAGASLAFKFPLGTGLKGILSEKLNIRFDDFGSRQESGSYQIVEALRDISRDDEHLRGKISPYVVAAQEIAEAMPMCGSIDDYIERHSGHREYDRCAKLGIAEVILEAERASSLRLDRRHAQTVNLSAFGDCWLSRFLQLATRGLHKSNIFEAFEKLHVIIFNYDRCFEQFTYYWLQQVYKVSPQEAGEIVAKIKIVHPYGSLGPLFPETRNDLVPFGCETHYLRLRSISDNLLTYSESVRNDDTSLPIYEYIKDSPNLVFLGFAFHQQNLNLLKLGSSEQPMVRNIYASTVGIPKPRWETIISRLSLTFDAPKSDLRTHTDDQSCERLLDEYSDSIAA